MKAESESVANFEREHFEKTFERSVNPTGKLFLQDGDPSQNSKKAKAPLDAVGARLFSIPPRSPVMNPIENVFNYIKDKLRQQALEQNITFENIEEFSARVKHTLENMPIWYIHKTISSMDNKISMVIKAGRKRIRH